MAQLSEEQKDALGVYEDETKNLLLLGAGGTGKSYLITNYFRHSSVITAMTGVAAFSIHGITLHSFLGIGTGKQNIAFLMKKVRRNRNAVTRIRSVSSLVIDEISMMSASLFEKIDQLCKDIRRCYHKPFGGIRIVLSGDFLQLLPIFDENEDGKLIFESTLFKTMFQSENTVLLNKNYRQGNSNVFHERLMRLRCGQYSEDDVSAFFEIMSTRNLENGTHLVSSKRRANEINQQWMKKLDSEERTFDAKYETTGKNENTKNWLEEELWTQMEQRDLNRVVLKKGCRVMLVVNLDVESGLVNGRTGEVVGFVDEYPKVRFANTTLVITSTTISLEHEDCVCTVTFLPLLLSYALTIHKSQSLTLDTAVMELGDCFAEHMVYVALSRVRRMEDVILKSFVPTKIRVNQKVMEFYNHMIKNVSIEKSVPDSEETGRDEPVQNTRKAASGFSEIQKKGKDWLYL